MDHRPAIPPVTGPAYGNMVKGVINLRGEILPSSCWGGGPPKAVEGFFSLDV
jgi:hypothetical protein